MVTVKMRPVNPGNSLLLVKLFTSIIKVTVLVVDGKDISKFAALLRQGAHSLVTARLWTRREHIRMIVIIPLLAPAVGVDIELIQPQLLEMPILLCPLIKGCKQLAVLSVFLIKTRFGMHIGKNAAVQHR